MVKKKVIINVFKRLEKKGMLFPKDVVVYARPVESEIHECFDWNNTSAAEKYRLWQARQLIASVRVEYLGKEFNGYYNAVIQVAEERTQAYFSKDKVANNEEIRQYVIEGILQEIKYWRMKYKEILDLAKIDDDLISIESKVRNQNRGLAV